MPQNQPTSPQSRKSQVRPAKKGVLKRLTLQGLRGMIEQLQGVVKKLEAEPSDIPQKKLGHWRRRLSRPILGGAIATIAIILIRFTPGLFFGSTPPPQVSGSPPITEPLPQPEEEVVIEESLLSEETVTVSETEPEEKEEVVIKEATPLEETLIEPEEEEEIVIEEATLAEEILIESETEAEADKLPLVLAATKPPQPLKFVQPPSWERSPEQDLIASIQNQIITQIIEQLDLDNILQSIEPHFSASLLSILVSDDWYTLTDPQQDEFAQILFNQTQKFDFTRLKIYNSQRKEIARNAMIGRNMIILDRMKS